VINYKINTIKVTLRRLRLRRLLAEAAEQGAQPTYHHLADALGVSQRTIIQDMTALKNQG
jgi:predicted DNA-binding transcriptional regulator YafY